MGAFTAHAGLCKDRLGSENQMDRENPQTLNPKPPKTPCIRGTGFKVQPSP